MRRHHVQGINHVVAAFGGGAGVVDSDAWVFETRPTLALSSTSFLSTRPTRGGTPVPPAGHFSFSFSFSADPATAAGAEPKAVGVDSHPT